MKKTLYIIGVLVTLSACGIEPITANKGDCATATSDQERYWSEGVQGPCVGQILAASGNMWNRSSETTFLHSITRKPMRVVVVKGKVISVQEL